MKSVCCIVIEKPEGSGTGFFVKKGDNLYIVTVKHVMYSDETKYNWGKTHVNKDGLIIEPFTGVKEYTPNAVYIIHNDIRYDIKYTLMPSLDNNDCVVLADIKSSPRLTNIVAIPFDMLAREEHQPVFNTKVFVIGFPGGLGLPDHPEIIAQSTRVSSSILKDPTYFSNRGSKLFLTSDPLAQGYSGSPIIDPQFSWGSHHGMDAVVYGVGSGTYYDATGGKMGIIVHASIIRKVLEKVDAHLHHHGGKNMLEHVKKY